MLIFNNMKFDVCLMNPPYNRSLHLKFLYKTIDISDKVISIQPASRLYINIKTRQEFINNYKQNNYKLESVDIINGKDFDAGIRDVCAISYFNKSKNTDNINVNIFNIETYNTNNIENVNIYGDIDIIQSIFNKIKNNKIDKQKQYYFIGISKKVNNLHLTNNAAYLRNAGDIVTMNGYNSKANWVLDNYHNKEYYGYITATYVHKNQNTILNKPEVQDGKSHPNGWTYYDKYDNFEKNKEKLENFKDFILNSNLAHFICFCYISNNSREYMPFYTDKFIDDNTIYKYFNFNKKEIETIEHLVNKIDHTSEWYKQYLY